MPSEMYKIINASARRSAREIGDARIADTTRKCPVPGCGKEAVGYSRYCLKHAYRLKKLGHPSIPLRINTRPSYEKTLKIGRWLREALSRDDPANRRGFMRVEDEITRIGTAPKYNHGVPVLSKRDKHWKNAFKARCLLGRKLNRGTSAEEILAGYLGLASVILLGNEVPMNAQQLRFCFSKAGGRVVARYLVGVARDPITYQAYEWKPGLGVITEAGRVIDDAIAAEFGPRWFKEAEVKLIVAVGGDPEKIGDLEVDMRDGSVAREYDRVLREQQQQQSEEDNSDEQSDDRSDDDV